MITIIMLILGIALVIGTIAALIRAVCETPENLRGFYGVFYTLISIGGVIGGIALSVLAFMV